MNLTWWSEHPSELPLLFLTAVVTHLLMSFSQTLMHYGLGHRRLGGMFFRNHMHYHHSIIRRITWYRSCTLKTTAMATTRHSF